MTKLPNDAPPPRVFLSYSHDSPDHAARVLELADRLRAEGVDAWIDQYVQAPPEGWPEWCERQIEEADFVLVVCTETYLARFRKKAPEGVGLGVKWEGHVITSELYESEGRNTKFVPVLLGNEPVASIPRMLRSATRYQLPQGYEHLYRRLADQPEIRVPELGKLRALPARERRSVLFDIESSPGPGSMEDGTRGSEQALLSLWLRHVADSAKRLLGEPAFSDARTTTGPSFSASKGTGGPATRSRPAYAPSGQQLLSTEWLHELSGQVLVYVPGDGYRLGAHDIDSYCRPVHTATLTSFWISKYPVTNAQYFRFLDANPYTRAPKYWKHEGFNQPEQPVVGVSWEEAVAYCEWAGMELPTEAQWEAAARRGDGRQFPWGNEKPSEQLANFGRNLGWPTPVGSYPNGAGPFGALDQAGNVSEWCADIWSPRAYYSRDGNTDPIRRHGDAAFRVLRGGSWASRPTEILSAFRSAGRSDHRAQSIGFRCVCRARPEP